jgi:hypothetical protein
MALTHKKLRVAEGQLTTAEVNAGTVVIAPMVDRVITVVDAWLRATGSAATVTSVDITDTASSPATAVAFARAGLTDGTVLRAGAANTTATGLGTALTEDCGVKVIKNGSDLATTTAVDYFIFYTVTEANR